MPDVEITIGDRKFYIACRAGEEPFLNAAAKMLDAEATPLQAQMGRLPEARMLLMAGLMLADRTASVEDELRQAKARLAELEARPPREMPFLATPEAPPPVPRAVIDSLSELAARAESIANAIEERLN